MIKHRMRGIHGFTATQAAQKMSENTPDATVKFTATQAAQKYDGSHLKLLGKFTATQAAQKKDMLRW